MVRRTPRFVVPNEEFLLRPSERREPPMIPSEVGNCAITKEPGLLSSMHIPLNLRPNRSARVSAERHIEAAQAAVLGVT